MVVVEGIYALDNDLTKQKIKAIAIWNKDKQAWECKIKQKETVRMIDGKMILWNRDAGVRHRTDDKGVRVEKVLCVERRGGGLRQGH